jgi:hypothetical protein
LLPAIAALVLALPASALAAAPTGSAGLPKGVCQVAEAIDRIHTLSELGKLMTGEFELKSAFLLVGTWGLEHQLCGHAGRKAHDILLNGIGTRELAPLLSDLPKLNLPRVPNVPTAHIAFPTISIASHASGANVGFLKVPISIRGSSGAAASRP